MKFTKNILMVLGLLLQVGVSFAVSSNKAQARAIMKRLNNRTSRPNSDWEPTGPTLEDILAATKVENLATKGSQEDQLITAVKNGDLKNVEALISVGTGLEARDNENMTALMIAAKKGYTDIASKLINAGANLSAINRYGHSTAFYYATQNNHLETVKLLIANDAAKNQKDYVKSLLVSEALKDNNEMVKALIVEVSMLDQKTLTTAYMVAGSAEVKNVIKEVLMQAYQVHVGPWLPE